ncbi:GNAT family N-acetyltransferase [uncultured Shewanella sp.]|uniref:GNAT family N-acetyltransferase n=1 Tax=Shewanella atlantica TaxID=271099 RepID=UPI002618F1B7|nr:GNAT family N-acetyltransferase [uncultured Shewanella sp.]
MEVIIRHTEPGDFVGIQALYAQAGAYSGTLQLPHPSQHLWQQRLAAPGPDSYSLVAEANGIIVGQIGMDLMSSPRRRHVGNIGMAVCSNQQNRGIGAQLLAAMLDLANNWLAVTRIELEVYTDNEAAIALYEKYGFVKEGTAKNYAFRDGRYVDAYLMARVSL